MCNYEQGEGIRRKKNLEPNPFWLMCMCAHGMLFFILRDVLYL